MTSQNPPRDPQSEAGTEFELVDAELVTSAGPAVSATALYPSPPPSAVGLEPRNLFAEAARIAARVSMSELLCTTCDPFAG